MPIGLLHCAAFGSDRAEGAARRIGSQLVRLRVGMLALVLRLRNFSSPAFSSTSAFLPSQTMTQSPCRILSFCMRYLWAQTMPPRDRPCNLVIIGPWSKRRRADSVARCEQPPRDDLRLDFRRALENAENAGVAEDARDRKLEREAVAAVDLHGVVGIGPGDAGGQELRHAGLEIAAFARILLPRREVSELACDHDFDRHHRDLVGDAGKIDDRLAELLALLGVGEGLLHGRLRHADCARR